MNAILVVTGSPTAAHGRDLDQALDATATGGRVHVFT